MPDSYKLKKTKPENTKLNTGPAATVMNQPTMERRALIFSENSVHHKIIAGFGPPADSYLKFDVTPMEMLQFTI